MKNFKETVGVIYREQKGMLVLQAVLLVLSLGVLIFSLVTLSPGSAVVKVGYGDIGSFSGDDLTEMRTAGGYRDGSWVNMLAFSLLSVTIGVVHNLIAVRLFARRGADIAKVFILMSIILLVGVVLVLFRLLGEG